MPNTRLTFEVIEKEETDEGFFVTLCLWYAEINFIIEDGSTYADTSKEAQFVLPIKSRALYDSIRIGSRISLEGEVY